MAEGNERIREHFEISLAQPEDAEELVGIMRQGWKEFIDPTTGLTEEFIDSRYQGEYLERRISEMKESIKGSELKFVVARTRNKIAGFLSFSITPEYNEFDRFFVREEFRAEVGLKLIAAVENMIDKHKDSVASVIVKNERAKRLYERLGFQQMDEPYERELTSPLGSLRQQMVHLIRKAEIDKA